MLKKGIASITLFAVVLIVLLFSSTSKANADAPMRKTVDNTHPINLIHFIGEQWEGDIRDVWNAVPSSVKPNSVIMPIIELKDDLSTTESLLTALADKCDANQIPIVLSIISGEYTVSQEIPIAFLENLINTHSYLIGYHAAELYNSVPWFGEAGGNHSQYVADLINMLANYGGLFVWTDTNVFGTNGILMDWIQNNSNLIGAMRAHKDNVILMYKQSYENASTDSLFLGLWLAGLIGNWGEATDAWTWPLNGYGGLYGSGSAGADWNRVVTWPEALYGSDIVRGASEGATAFLQEAGFYTGVAKATKLSTTGWSATASNTYSANTTAMAFDNNINTRWANGANQSSSQWFTLDMGASKLFSRVSLKLIHADQINYMRGYKVYVSNDGVNWGTGVATGVGNSVGDNTDIFFPQQSARYIKIALTGSTSGIWFSISELEVYNSNLTPTYKNVTIPLLTKFIDGTFTIPSRADVLAKNKVAYIGKPAWSVPYYGPYSGLYLNNGRYGIIPLLPTNANSTEKANFENNLTVQKDAAYFNTLYPAEVSQSNTFASRNGNQWYWMNNSENTNVTQFSTMIPKINTAQSFRVEAGPHTFAIIKEATDKFTVHLNNYRVDKTSLHNGTTSINDLTSVINWVGGSYTTSPDVSALRTTVIKVKGTHNGSQPQLTISGDNGYTYTEEFDNTSKEYVLTIQHNGPVNIVITCDGTSVPSTKLSTSGWSATASNTYSSYTTAMAFDNNINTRWATGASQANGQWFTLDMGKSARINKVIAKLISADVSSNYMRGYDVFVSSDGTNWGSKVATGVGSQTGDTTILFPEQNARYIKIVQTGSATGLWWSFSELEVYGQTDLMTSNWTATASLTAASNTPNLAIDYDINTRWATGAGQANGQWYQLDMGESNTFSQITIKLPSSDLVNYMRGYQVFVSTDGTTWGSAIATGVGNSTGDTVITFSPQTARYIKLVQTGTSSTYWWSLSELVVG